MSLVIVEGYEVEMAPEVTSGHHDTDCNTDSNDNTDIDGICD